MNANTNMIVMNAGQQNALDKFVQFLLDPDKWVFVLRGYSGTGKSTLIKTLLENLPKYIKAAQLIDEEYMPPPIQLTATTHKAADNLNTITGKDVTTIHSFLGLRINTDYTTGVKSLVPVATAAKHGYLIFIDEASYIDPRTLNLIFQQAPGCKIVFMGDPAQLLMPKCNEAPVFKAGFEEAMLTEPMRQMVNGVPQANPITDLATMFRHTVETGVWPSGLKLDGQYVKWLPREDFYEAIKKEFIRDDWHYQDSKVLAWTNATVIAYNNTIRGLLKGDPALQVGDYAENNSHVRIGNHSIATDATVLISEIEPESSVHGVNGNWITVNRNIRVFHPYDRTLKKKAAARLRASGDFGAALEVDNWVDLRAVFAQTVNKAQGSTYDMVFIDLDDIKKCNMGHLVARMLYVGISRARLRVRLTGDLI